MKSNEGLNKKAYDDNKPKLKKLQKDFTRPYPHLGLSVICTPEF